MLHRKLAITLILLISFLFVVSLISNKSIISSKEKIEVIVKLKDIDSNLIQGFAVYDGVNLDKKYYYSSTDSYLISIDKDKLEELKSNENIELISEEQSYHATLQDALPSSNITLVQESFNLTGKSQTICILDTGINYSHRDLGNCTEEDFLESNCNKVIAGYDFVNNDNNPYDDAGHGSHVAGIISRTAPDANIISVKVLDQYGDGSSSDISAGIDFCINNKEIYNITIISMSLGGGLYSNYCNSESLKPFVDAALLKNITVVASTGNDFSKTKISGPACIYGATSVGSLNKDNSISSYSNRNKNTIILAIGSEINSTSISGDYETMSGTSMSTPLVAGTIALLNQYQSENLNRILTPYEINSILKNKGNNITDSTGINYSRLNAYNLLNIETIVINETNTSETIENPVIINLISPVNNFTSNSTNLTFECLASSNSYLTNISLYLGNSTSFENKETKEISGISNISIFNVVLNNNQTQYFWNCLSFNNQSISNFSSGNFSIIINISQIANLTNTINISITTENNTNINNNQNTNSGSGESSGSSDSSESISEPQLPQLTAEIITEQNEDNQVVQYKASQINNSLRSEQTNSTNTIENKKSFFSNLMTGQAVSLGENFKINNLYLTIFLVLIIVSASTYLIFKIKKNKTKK